MNFTLVNPYIEGSFEKSYKAKSALEAANNCWSSLSKHLVNHVPQFAFTMKNTKTGGYSHFHVKEHKNKKDKIKYTLEEIQDQNINSKDLDLHLNKNQEHNKNLIGGRNRHWDDDSSDDSFDDYYKYKRYPLTPLMPISYWSYYPACYRIDYLYIPTFIAPIAPYINIYGYIGYY
ncbi:hypothetical protein Hokovirus_3_274 [Hokovirus HKV1]|uniref:Uncharacterized protein n=1 Tax=Hokovirus HKV1 TaxID=1977638 RepID=A0A1V0SH62_9VIRU|nr:hypothetical protein Hokovirus_3_274 [Hokovirus HKV1]